jgi:hypothetical protein
LPAVMPGGWCCNVVFCWMIHYIQLISMENDCTIWDNYIYIYPIYVKWC